QDAARGHRIPVRDESASRAGAAAHPMLGDLPHPAAAHHAEARLGTRRLHLAGARRTRAGLPFPLIPHGLLVRAPGTRQRRSLGNWAPGGPSPGGIGPGITPLNGPPRIILFSPGSPPARPAP